MNQKNYSRKDTKESIYIYIYIYIYCERGEASFDV